jgi:hypothetical protein
MVSGQNGFSPSTADRSKLTEKQITAEFTEARSCPQGRYGQHRPLAAPCEKAVSQWRGSMNPRFRSQSSRVLA